MRFVIAANTPDSRTTGLGRQMHGVTRALSDRGHRVDLVFQSSLHSLLPGRFARLEFPHSVARYVNRIWQSGEGPIACILHEPVAWATALCGRRLDGVRTVAMVHNCEAKCWRVMLETSRVIGRRIPLRSRISWPLTELSQAWLSLRLADQVLCLSTEDRDYLRNQMKLPADKVTRIDNGLEAAFLNLPGPGAPRERDVLFMASWLPHKGTRQFSQALGEVWRRGVRPRVTIAGTGVCAEAVLADLPEACREEIEVREHVEPSQLIGLYSRHRIFVLPSITEGMPLSLLEAMASGLCPVVTKVGGVPDVLTDGRNGVFVPPSDPIALANTLLGLLEADDLVIRIATQAYRRAQVFGWSQVALQIERALGF